MDNNRLLLLEKEKYQKSIGKHQVLYRQREYILDAVGLEASRFDRPVLKALAIDSQNAEALLLRAIAYSKYKSIAETAIAYREVTRANPYFFEAYKGLVDSLINLSQIKEAIQMAGNAMKAIGSNPRTLTVTSRF